MFVCFFLVHCHLSRGLPQFHLEQGQPFTGDPTSVETAAPTYVHEEIKCLYVCVSWALVVLVV